MVAKREPRTMTIDEWRVLERATPDVKYEYIDGWVYLMSGGTANHARICINAVRALEDALGNSPCNVYNSDLRVRLSEIRYVYPDASVTYDKHDQGDIDMVQSPRLILEVLHRTPQGWAAYHARLYGPGDTIKLASINVQFPLALLYRRSTVREAFELYTPENT